MVNLPKTNPESNKGSWVRDRKTMKIINRRRHSGYEKKPEQFYGQSQAQ
jgi:hypothetical protein